MKLSKIVFEQCYKAADSEELFRIIDLKIGQKATIWNGREERGPFRGGTVAIPLLPLQYPPPATLGWDKVEVIYLGKVILYGYYKTDC